MSMQNPRVYSCIIIYLLMIILCIIININLHLPIPVFILMPRLHDKPIMSEFLGVGTMHEQFWKALWDILKSSQDGKTIAIVL